jgi:hypothetical protein
MGIAIAWLALGWLGAGFVFGAWANFDRRWNAEYGRLGFDHIRVSSTGEASTFGLVMVVMGPIGLLSGLLICLLDEDRGWEPLPK